MERSSWKINSPDLKNLLEVVNDTVHFSSEIILVRRIAKVWQYNSTTNRRQYIDSIVLPINLMFVDKTIWNWLCQGGTDSLFTTFSPLNWARITFPSIPNGTYHLMLLFTVDWNIFRNNNISLKLLQELCRPGAKSLINPHVDLCSKFATCGSDCCYCTLTEVYILFFCPKAKCS